MKIVFLVLCAVFLAMQYEIWLAPSNGILAINRMELARKEQIQLNQQQKHKNQLLAKSIKDLKTGHLALEEHARYDLGMIKPDEQFYQIIGKQ